jgi:hypothetical protein
MRSLFERYARAVTIAAISKPPHMGRFTYIYVPTKSGKKKPDDSPARQGVSGFSMNS